MHPFLKHLTILKKKGEDTSDMDRKEFYIPVVRVRVYIWLVRKREVLYNYIDGETIMGFVQLLVRMILYI